MWDLNADLPDVNVHVLPGALLLFFFQKMLLLTYIILAGVMSVAHAHYIKGLWFTSFPDSYSYPDYLRERH